MPHPPLNTQWENANQPVDRLRLYAVALVLLLTSLVIILGIKSFPFRAENELLHVSFDGAKTFFQEFDKRYADGTFEENFYHVSSAHAGSVQQAFGITSGLIADIVSFASPLESDEIARETGFIRRNWREHFPYGSSPFYSTIVMVVAAGNPKAIRDWGDLTRKEVNIMAPDPTVSGSGRYAYLCTLLVEHQTKECQSVRPSFSQNVFMKCKLIAQGASQVSRVFLHSPESDVLLTWESEAVRMKRLYPDKFDIVYPAFSILAEPVVAVVDTHVEKRNTRAPAEAYIRHLFTEEGQELAASNGFRPRADIALDTPFPSIELFSVEDVFEGWDCVYDRHFSTKGSWNWIRRLRAARIGGEE
ncbi:MAG: sulfate ABC transporter substrate-binding protein [Verrucomicrobiae bacterium]|nr:sulfate ABC transporter substrate-binding protein [Verrucomicrobiae bacterium]